MSTSIFKLLERLWLAGAAIGVLGCIYFLIVKDNDSALFFFGFFLISAVSYLMRKRQRIKHESALQEQKDIRKK